MDIVLMIMAAFAILGLADDFIGGKLGLADSFTTAMQTTGRVIICCSGFYCIGISLVEKAAEPLARLSEVLPFEASLFLSCIASSDCGSLPVAMAMAENPAVGIFSGALVAGTLGASLGYQFPYFISALEKKYIPVYIQGIAFGLISAPVGLIAGGLLLDMSMSELLLNTMPVAMLCLLVVVGVKLSVNRTIKVLYAVTKTVQLITYVLFALVVADVFIPWLKICDVRLVEEISYLSLRMVLVTCGAMVMANLAVRYLGGPIRMLGRLMKVNEESVVGLFISLFNSVGMLPLLPKMDRRGLLLNIAFSVCGAYCLGGQMAFVSSVIPGDCMPAYMVNKLAAGLTAMLIAAAFVKKTAVHAGEE